MRASLPYMKSNLLTTLFFILITTMHSFAQSEVDDFFRSTGKINTVLGVVVILFCVILFFLLRLESKIKKLEKHQGDE